MYFDAVDGASWSALFASAPEANVLILPLLFFDYFLGIVRVASGKISSSISLSYSSGYFGPDFFLIPIFELSLVRPLVKLLVIFFPGLFDLGFYSFSSAEVSIADVRASELASNSSKLGAGATLFEGEFDASLLFAPIPCFNFTEEAKLCFLAGLNRPSLSD